MAKRTFIACARTDCRWNEDGQCNAAEIFVDEGPTCRTYEPGAASAPGPLPAGMAAGALAGAPGGGGMADALRQAILARLSGSATPQGPGAPMA